MSPIHRAIGPGRSSWATRFGQISIEGAAQRGSLSQDSNRAGFDLTQLSVAGKYSLPISDGFEAFGRFGYQHTGLGSQDSATGGQLDISGSGFLLGAGIEYRVNLVATSASIFLDYNFTTSSMGGPSLTVPQTLQTRGFTIGATVGFCNRGRLADRCDLRATLTGQCRSHRALTPVGALSKVLAPSRDSSD